MEEREFNTNQEWKPQGPQKSMSESRFRGNADRSLKWILQILTLQEPNASLSAYLPSEPVPREAKTEQDWKHNIKASLRLSHENHM